MLYNAEAADKPRKVTIEHLPDGQNRVLLTDNIQKDERDDGTIYTYEVVEFYLPDGQKATVKAITEEFATWWEYGQTPDDNETIEDRVSALEDLILDMLG